MTINTSYTKQGKIETQDFHSREIIGNLTIERYENALILPFNNHQTQLGGVVSCEEEFIDNSGLYEERTVGFYKVNEDDIIEDNSVVLYLGMLLKIYGHAITDNLKKIWAIRDCEYKYDRIYYIADWETEDMPAYVSRIFQLAGVDLSKMKKIEKPTRCKEVLIPDNSFVHHLGEKYFHKKFCDTIDIIKSRIECFSSYPDKIFFTRSGIKQQWHRDWNESKLDKIFSSLGYTIISPEKMTVDEQISALVNCSHFAATEGSVAHNSVFCKPGTKVTLIRKVDLFNAWQLAINEIADLDVSYVDAHNSVRTNEKFPMIGPFYVCITKELERYVGRYILHLPLILRPSWYMYKYRLDENPFLLKFQRIYKKFFNK